MPTPASSLVPQARAQRSGARIKTSWLTLIIYLIPSKYQNDLLLHKRSCEEDRRQFNHVEAVYGGKKDPSAASPRRRYAGSAVDRRGH